MLHHPAMLKKPLSDQWRAWIRQNVARGCSREELSRILLKEGFDVVDIGSELGPAPSSASKAALPPRPQPKAAPKAALLPGLERHGAPRLELYTVANFVDARTCAALVELIKAGLRPSTISSENAPEASFRTSRTCDLDERYPVVRELNRKICAALDANRSYAEATQGQYYEVGQEFKAHTDYFEAYELERFSTATWGQRTWTFMVYLNEPAAGGETHFVDAGFAFRPKLGQAVIWNNLHPDGQPNPHTLHQGMPVTSGAKAIITKWFRRPR
ncbi:MAG: prolyl hydroxylase family protein [Burkholderiales bacterium]